MTVGDKAQIETMMDKILQHGKIIGLNSFLILLKQHLDGDNYRIKRT